MKIWQQLLALGALVALFSFAGATLVFQYYRPSPGVPVENPVRTYDIVLGIGYERLGETHKGKDHVLDLELCDTVLIKSQAPESGYLSVLVAEGSEIYSVVPSDGYTLSLNTRHKVLIPADHVTQNPASLILIWSDYLPDTQLYADTLDYVAGGHLLLRSEHFPQRVGNTAVVAYSMNVGPDTHDRFDLIKGCLR